MGRRGRVKRERKGGSEGLIVVDDEEGRGEE